MESINLDLVLEGIRLHIRHVLQKTGVRRVVVAVSGGIDSALVLYLLRRSLPVADIHVFHLPYFESSITDFHTVVDPLDIPKNNIHILPIDKAVQSIAHILQIQLHHADQSALDRLRLGNVMARVRMTILFDQAKKLNALVCGTENKTEYYLGYYTRFGDSASDFEVIDHLYKTEVRLLAKKLQVPQSIIQKAPSAGLWEGQTDEKELGFSYEEIDRVLQLYFDKKMVLEEIEALGNTNASKIIERVKKNEFKPQLPYKIKSSSF